MRRNSLITGLLIVLGIVVVTRAAISFKFPAFLFAQSNPPAATGGGDVGTHAAFFDPGGNIKIANLVKSKSGNKITVMVNITAPTDEINSILAAADGLAKIVRIVGVDHGTSQDHSYARGIATSLNNSNIQPDTIVVFGNEVNNLDKEWKLCSAACPGQTAQAAAEYGAFYRAFLGEANKSKYKPVPSPLDMYNGVYTDPQTFISQAGVYGQELVANVYEVGAGLSQGLAYPGTVIAYTEYGPDPAKSLQEHINFYKNNPPPVFATTLVPDKCNPGTDQWLYYIAGKIYDVDGNEIDPVTCDKSKRGLPPEGDYYKRFIYPFYSTQSTAEDIKQKLVNDYSMTCSDPALFGTQMVGGTIEEMIQYQVGRCDSRMNPVACLFDPEATLSVSSEGVNRLFGVLRNEYEARWRAYDYSINADGTKRSFFNRFESVEQWFGANNPVLHSPGGTAEYLNQSPSEVTGLHQGPYYKLVPVLGQCFAQGEVLRASQELCDAWSALPENAGQKCSLTERKVQGTGKTYGQLYSEVGNYEALCGIVLDPPDSDPPVRPTAQQVELVGQMSRVDLYQETAYRPAFLVLVTTYEDRTTVQPISPSNPNQQVHPKGKNYGGTEGTDKVDFLVYHVPDTITDIKEGEPGAMDDIITRTARSFTPLETTDKAVEKWAEERSAIAGFMQTPPELVNCKQGVCDEPLRRALIDFINAYIAANPDDLEYPTCDQKNPNQAESGSRIGSELAPNDTDPLVAASMKNGQQIDEAGSDILIEEYRTGSGAVNPRIPTPKTRIYNITPHGFRTEFVAASFDALFAQAQLEGQFKPDDKYLTTFESIFGTSFDNQPDVVTYTKPIPGEPVLVNGVLQPPFEEVEVRDEVTLDPEGYKATARIPWLAKVFNFSTRGIVQQITGVGENLLECARAVADPRKNTEDFLLRCQSRGSAVGSVNPPGSPGDLGEPAAGFEAFAIEYWTGALENFRVPPQMVVDAANAAAAKHGCDPYLVIATAHSESRQYTNTTTENSATAMGVWQFTWGNWASDVWNLPFFTTPPATSNFSKSDGSNFNCANPTRDTSGTCSRTNVYASADAACRLLNAIGANAQYSSHENFVEAFSVPENPHNQYGRVWNVHRPQGEYVWRLWHALREKDYGETYKEQVPSLL